MSATSVSRVCTVNGFPRRIPFIRTPDWGNLTRKGKRVFGEICRGTSGVDSLIAMIKPNGITNEDFDTIVESGAVVVPGF